MSHSLWPTNISIIGVWITEFTWRVGPRFLETMAEILITIATPCIQLGLRSKPPIKPLPASAVSVEERLRRDTKGVTGEGSPVVGILVGLRRRDVDVKKAGKVKR
ncbi:MAG: hypothetical protein Q9172_006523 [Xanthocarpia lactea]